MTEGWPTEYTEHTEGFLTGGNGEGGGRLTEDWPRRGAKGAEVGWQRTDDGGRTAEGGAYGPSQTHGLESPCHVAWAFQPMSGRPRIAPVAQSCARDLTAGGRQRPDDDSAW